MFNTFLAIFIGLWLLFGLAYFLGWLEEKIGLIPMSIIFTILAAAFGAAILHA